MVDVFTALIGLVAISFVSVTAFKTMKRQSKICDEED